MIRRIFTLTLALGLTALPGVAHAESAESAARAYIQALLTHDASDVPLAEDAHRVENGIPTGSSGEDIRCQLENGPQYRVVMAIRELTVRTRGDHVDTHYLLDAGVLGVKLVTTDITETFEVPNGLIKEINATITLA